MAKCSAYVTKTKSESTYVKAKINASVYGTLKTLLVAFTHSSLREFHEVQKEQKKKVRATAVAL